MFCTFFFFLYKRETKRRWFPPVVSWESPLEYSYVGSGVCRK